MSVSPSLLAAVGDSGSPSPGQSSSGSPSSGQSSSGIVSGSGGPAVDGLQTPAPSDPVTTVTVTATPTIPTTEAWTAGDVQLVVVALTLLVLLVAAATVGAWRR